MKGLGSGLASPILHVAFPSEFGIWNGVSDACLRNLGVWDGPKPSDPRGYPSFNELLLRLSSALSCTLWVLDALFWHQQKRELLSVGGENPGEDPEDDDPTYLFTWNPDKSGRATLTKWREKLEEELAPITTWSAGIRKDLNEGERFFFLKQGKEPRGIVAAGYLHSGPFEQEHWEEQRASQGDTAVYVHLSFEEVLDDQLPPLSQQKLVKEFAEVNWSPQASGTKIQKRFLKDIEIL